MWPHVVFIIGLNYSLSLLKKNKCAFFVCYFLGKVNTDDSLTGYKYLANQHINGRHHSLHSNRPNPLR